MDKRKVRVSEMEENKTIFDYCGSIFTTFGFTILLMSIFCILVGEEASEVSSLYSMGRDGLSVATILQFFGVAVCITLLRVLFFTDTLIKRMSVTQRTVCMLLCVIGLIVVCAAQFRWFPINMWQAWAGFAASFGICFAVSCVLTMLKERLQNRRMEEALTKLKEQENVKCKVQERHRNRGEKERGHE